MAEHEPLTQTMNTADAARGFPKLVNKVARRETRVVLQEDGKPVAAIISADDLERLRRAEARGLEWRQVLGRMRKPFKNIPEDRLEREVAAVVEEVRREQRKPQR